MQLPERHGTPREATGLMSSPASQLTQSSVNSLQGWNYIQNWLPNLDSKVAKNHAPRTWEATSAHRKPLASKLTVIQGKRLLWASL